MKKILLSLFALGILQLTHAQKKEKVTFKPPVIKKDKQTGKYVKGKKVTGAPLSAPPPPPPPPPRAFKAPQVPPPPPPPPPPPQPLIKKSI